MGQTIAIQGVQASFHDIAARQFFSNDIEIVACESFKQTFEALETADFALVAIENSLYGSINEVYDLLLKHNAWICGEVYLRVAQCLIGLPGADMNTINEIHSHPVALAQCEDFLDQKLPQAVRFEHHDTAASVADVKKWNDPTKAAIASKAAAQLHGMEILAAEIETNKQNYTRFVVISNQDCVVKEANKTSLVLRTHGDTKAGALYNALGCFAKRGINMSLLHSRPVIGKAWHYMFYVDVEISNEDVAFKAALRELEALGCEVSVLGSYLGGLS